MALSKHYYAFIWAVKSHLALMQWLFNSSARTHSKNSTLSAGLMILLLKSFIGSMFYFTMHFIISRSFITVFYYDKRELLCWSGIKFQSISAANGFKAVD
jgi:hypothetical protein